MGEHRDGMTSRGVSGEGQQGVRADDREREDDPDLTASSTGGVAGDPAAGADETSSTGANAVGGTGASASGDAHLGHDGRELGDPTNSRRQVPPDGTPSGGRDIANGSGAD